jgi:hypothetical protein
MHRIRPWAAGESEMNTKPVYRPSDPPLPYSRDQRQAAIDVMILSYSLREHAEHVARMGHLPQDIRLIVANDLRRTLNALFPAQVGDVGPRSRGAKSGDGDTTALWTQHGETSGK